MTKERTCPKCGGRMAWATAGNFGNIFGCTREPKNLEVLQGEEIQSYFCEDCGYVEFYKAKLE